MVSLVSHTQRSTTKSKLWLEFRGFFERKQQRRWRWDGGRDVAAARGELPKGENEPQRKCVVRTPLGGFRRREVRHLEVGFHGGQPPGGGFPGNSRGTRLRG